MEKMFKNLKVGKKLQVAFGMILGILVIIEIVAIIASEVIQYDFKVFYQECYQDNIIQMEIRKDIQVVGKMVLWSMTTEDEAMGDMCLSNAENYANKVVENVTKLKQVFSDKELLDRLDTALEEMRTYRIELTTLAKANQNQEALELFNNEYNTATENIQNILIAIGEESEQLASEIGRAHV